MKSDGTSFRGGFPMKVSYWRIDETITQLNIQTFFFPRHIFIDRNSITVVELNTNAPV